MIGTDEKNCLTETLTVLLSDPAPGLWLAKLLGALAGSLISVAYVLPNGRREAALRFFVGVVMGLVFGGPAGVKLADWLGVLSKVDAFEIALGGAAFTSLTAWWMIGLLKRWLNHLKQPSGRTTRSTTEEGEKQ